MSSNIEVAEKEKSATPSRSNHGRASRPCGADTIAAGDMGTKCPHRRTGTASPSHGKKQPPHSTFNIPPTPIAREPSTHRAGY
jgi:hypothetical protein